ncbi:MAG: hypothetical protein U0232_08760 [Thermomicrobiales bacterium]
MSTSRSSAPVLHPLMNAADVLEERARALHAAIRAIPADAVNSGGTTFSTIAMPSAGR